MTGFETIFVETPIGALKVSVADGLVFGAVFVEESTEIIINEDHLVAKNVISYFYDRNNVLNQLVQMAGTPFQEQVWRLVSAIPCGQTRSYKQIAQQLGDEQAVRAVGNAVGKNKSLLFIPCHRVIGSDDSITGYAGGLWRKEWLLNHERQIAGGQQRLF
jgi:methylated-DNA-[protein]-cysteine S-methyltransferase